MKIKVKNIGTGTIKIIDSNVLNDYLSTKKWVKAEENKAEENKNKKSNFTINNQEDK